MWDDESRYAPGSDTSESHVDRIGPEPVPRQRWSGRASAPLAGATPTGAVPPATGQAAAWDPAPDQYGHARAPEPGMRRPAAAAPDTWHADHDERDTWDPRYDGPAAGRAFPGEEPAPRHVADPYGERRPTREGWSGAQHAAPEQSLPPWRPVGAANVATSTAAAAGWAADTRRSAGTATTPQRATGVPTGPAPGPGSFGERPAAFDGQYRDDAAAAGPDQAEDEQSPAVRSDRSPYNWLLYLPVLLPLCTPLYNRIEPTMFGMPFFYWSQLSFTFLSAAVIAGVHLATKDQ